MTIDISNAPNAGVLKRLAAMFYDLLLLFGVLFTATLIPALLFSEPTHQNASGDTVYEVPTAMTGPLFQVYLICVIAIFFSWFWHKQGQTLGMQAWKIKLLSQDNQLPSLTQCIIRLLGATLSLLCLGMGYWWLWIDKDKLTWHDRWSKTKVVQLSKDQQMQLKKAA